jgi:hypothetical protein
VTAARLAIGMRAVIVRTIRTDGEAMIARATQRFLNGA